VGKRVGCEDSGVGSKVVGNLDGLGDGRVVGFWLGEVLGNPVGLREGTEFVGSLLGAGVGSDDGMELGDGDGIDDGLFEGVFVVGN